MLLIHTSEATVGEIVRGVSRRKQVELPAAEVQHDPIGFALLRQCGGTGFDVAAFLHVALPGEVGVEML